MTLFCFGGVSKSERDILKYGPPLPPFSVARFGALLLNSFSLKSQQHPATLRYSAPLLGRPVRPGLDSRPRSLARLFEPESKASEGSKATIYIPSPKKILKLSLSLCSSFAFFFSPPPSGVNFSPLALTVLSLIFIVFAPATFLLREGFHLSSRFGDRVGMLSIFNTLTRTQFLFVCTTYSNEITNPYLIQHANYQAGHKLC